MPDALTNALKDWGSSDEAGTQPPPVDLLLGRRTLARTLLEPPYPPEMTEAPSGGFKLEPRVAFTPRSEYTQASQGSNPLAHPPSMGSIVECSGLPTGRSLADRSGSNPVRSLVSRAAVQSRRKRHPLCRAMAPDGWRCEGQLGHKHLEHFAGGWVDTAGKVHGDHVWTGHTRWRWTEYLVWERVLLAPARGDDIAAELGLGRSTVFRHLARLRSCGLVQSDCGLWSSTV